MSAGLRFLSVDDVLVLHALALENQGGDPTLRDRNLLESAVAMPAQQFDSQYLHVGIPAMAAAYAFHICKNHPFVDGNKRAATAAMIAFLSDNGWSFDATADEAEPAILQLASGLTNKEDWTKWVGTHVHEKPRLELREFFRAACLPDTNRLAEAAVASGRQSEVDATYREALLSIPMIGELEDRKTHWTQSGDLARAKQMESAQVLLVLLFRLAEEMGYEW